MIAASNASNTALGVVGGILATIVVFAAYWLPLIVAVKRHHPNRGAIGILTFFLGWTMIGWVVALVWAFTTPVQPVVVVNQQWPTQ